MFKRAIFIGLAMLLCFALISASAYYDTDVWIDHSIIQYGESIKVHWKRDPGDPERDITYSLTTFEDNNRQQGSDYFNFYNAPLQGEMEIIPKTGGTIFMWFHTGGDYWTFPVQVLNGPDEGDFRSDINLDKASAMPGEEMTATVSLVGGRQPMRQTWIVWKVRDASGDLHEIERLPGLTSTITVPNGIQGLVETQTTDNADRTTLARQTFGIGPGEPLQVSMRLDKASVIVGQPITADWLITGGEAPYKAEPRWALTSGFDGLGLFGDYEEGPLFSTFSPEEEGYASVYIAVQDAKSREAETDKKTFLVTNQNGSKVEPRYDVDSNVPSDSGEQVKHVADQAEIFSYEEIIALEGKMQNIYDTYGFDTVIVTTEDSRGQTAQMYAADFYDKFHNYHDYSDGLIFFFNFDIGEYYEATRGLGIKIFSEQGEDVLDELLRPFFNESNYFGAMEAYLDYVDDCLLNYTRPPDNRGK